MSLINEETKEQIEDLFYEHTWIRYVAYAGCGLLGIWILGKASLLLSDSIRNFKNLHNAIKQ